MFSILVISFIFLWIYFLLWNVSLYRQDSCWTNFDLEHWLKAFIKIHNLLEYWYSGMCHTNLNTGLKMCCRYDLRVKRDKISPLSQHSLRFCSVGMKHIWLTGMWHVIWRMESPNKSTKKRPYWSKPSQEWSTIWILIHIGRLQPHQISSLTLSLACTPADWEPWPSKEIKWWLWILATAALSEEHRAPFANAVQINVT